MAKKVRIRWSVNLERNPFRLETFHSRHFVQFIKNPDAKSRNGYTNEMPWGLSMMGTCAFLLKFDIFNVSF